jgi:uncharacterized protein (TIGR03067 family)
VRNMTRSIALAAVVVGLALSAGAGGHNISPLEGAWLAQSAVRNGKPAHDVKGHRLVFTGKAFSIDEAGKTLYRGTFTADPAGALARIDFEHTEGELKGTTWKGIYAREDDMLKICDNAPDLARPRPTTFAAPADSGYLVVTFRREKR